MSDSVRFIAGTFAPMLRTLSSLLDTGARQVEARGASFAELAEARLAPDMYPLARQVRIACELAEKALARLTASEPPKAGDDDASLQALQARIAAAIAFIEAAIEAAMDDAREIEVPLQGDLYLQLTSAAFLRDWALPNFYFHLVTAYDILRHCGIEIGKRDYMSHLGPSVRRRASVQA